MEENKWLVYVHENKINGKKYYGITSQGVNTRWGKDGRNYNSSPYFYNAIQKYGWNNFEHKILITGLNEKQAKEKEKEFISKYKTNNKQFGYNMTSGGDGTVGLPFTKEMNDKRGTCKSVVQLDKEGNKINEFYNLHEANRETGVNFSKISSICNKYYGRKSAGGFYWMFTEEYNNWDKNIDTYLNSFEKTPIKHPRKVKNNKKTKNKNKVEIFQFDINGNIVKEFESISEAMRFTNDSYESIIASCKNKTETSSGNNYRYSKEDFCERKLNKRVKSVSQYDVNGTLIQTFDKIMDAEKSTGISNQTISDCCRGKQKTSGGFIWKYT